MATYRLWPSTDGNATDESTSPINLGTEVVLSSTGWVTALHFWRATLSELGPVTGAVYAVVSGAQVPGTAVTFTLSGTGWQTATPATPVQLAASVRYVVVIHHTDRYAGTGGYFASGPGASGITSGILTAPSAAAVSSAPIGNGRFDEAGTIAAPTTTFNGGNYWSDITVTDEDPAGAAASGSASSTGSASGIRGVVGSTSGSAAGSGSATGARSALAAASGSAAGAGSADGLRSAIGVAGGFGASAGSAGGSRVAMAAAAGTGESSATATGSRTAVAAASGTASGSGLVDGDGRIALGGGTSSGVAAIHPLIHRPRRGIIHRP
ncbi:DUF4082 domain-containing protein [Embleya sp. NPDC005971]|uniref:DUF4082 domain-containing protein n=1 Tax=Embleya sp. NPDC005971 TaxID=3156724 RepID=UPI0033CABA69